LALRLFNLQRVVLKLNKRICKSMQRFNTACMFLRLTTR
jgi:hypothetical protein